MSKNILLLVIGLSITAIVFVCIALSMFFGKQSQKEVVVSQNPTPTLYPTIIPVTPVAKARVPYAEKPSETMLEKLKTRTALSAADVTAKNKLIAITGGKSGPVHSTEQYAISYLKTADVFQVEVLTTDVVLAKKAAVQWLRDQGLTQKAVCDLPITFYLNFSVANQLKNTGLVFNPLAEGCS